MWIHASLHFSRIILLQFDSKVQNQFSSQTVSGLTTLVVQMATRKNSGWLSVPSLQYVTRYTKGTFNVLPSDMQEDSVCYQSLLQVNLTKLS